MTAKRHRILIPDLLEQSGWDYADSHYQEYGLVIGVSETPISNKSWHNYLHTPVPDADTPSQEIIDSWVRVGTDALDKRKRVLIHCLAGHNRSIIVAASIHGYYSGLGFKKIVEQYHNDFLLEDPPHNWRPYAHWDNAIKDYLYPLLFY